MDMSPTYVGYKFRSLALANSSPNSNLLIHFEFLEFPIVNSVKFPFDLLPGQFAGIMRA